MTLEEIESAFGLAFREGYECYGRGGEYEENPFPVGTTDCLDFINGITWAATPSFQCDLSE